MSDQLKTPACLSFSESLEHEHPAHGTGAQTDRGDNRSAHQTQRSHNKKGRTCFSYTAAFILPLQSARAGNKEKAERTSETSQLPKMKRSEPHL